MDIRQSCQSVLSFAGGKLVFSTHPPRTPKVSMPKKAKVVKEAKEVKGAKKRTTAGGGASARKPKGHPRTGAGKKRKPSETKKRLRSFVKKANVKKKKAKRQKKKKNSAGVATAASEGHEASVAQSSQPPGELYQGGLTGTGKATVAFKKKSSKLKMMRVTSENTPEILEMEGRLVPSDVTLEAETQHLNRQNTVSGFDGWMEAEIRQMLNTKQEVFCLETSAKVDDLREKLPRMTRAEEDNWLVEVSRQAEKAVCEMGMNCESVCMSNAKGINPPILLPCVEKEGFNSYKMCLLCLRNTSTCTLLRLRMDRVSMIQESCLQTHVNYVNLNGEYKIEHTLPIRRDKYEVCLICLVVVCYFRSDLV